MNSYLTPRWAAALAAFTVSLLTLLGLAAFILPLHAQDAPPPAAITAGAPVDSDSHTDATPVTALPHDTTGTAAASPSVPTPASEATAPSWLTDLLHKAVDKAPWLVLVFSLMGLLRTLIKPVMTWLESRVAETESTEDDEKLARFKASRVWRWTCFALDFLASIKLAPRNPGK